jgi:hypothetical protein
MQQKISENKILQAQRGFKMIIEISPYKADCSRCNQVLFWVIFYWGRRKPSKRVLCPYCWEREER